MKKLILLLLPLFALAGCMKEDDLRFREVKDVSVSLGATTAVNTEIVVENVSRRDVKISDAEFRVFDGDGRELGVITTAVNELLLPRKSVTSLTVPLRIRLSNPVLGLGLLANIEENARRMKVTGGAVIKAGALRKDFRIEGMPLSEFLAIFTGDTSK